MIIILGVGGFLTAQIAQRVIVPILVYLLGERRFASPSAFDGCTLGIAGAVVSVCGQGLLETRAKIAASHHQPFHASPLWILLIVGIGITLYGLLFLWVLGSDGKRQEWKITEDRIFNREGQELRPTFVRDRSEYNQTDAFNGYSHYFLELHSDTGLLATNSYNSKDDFRRDAGQVRELTNARQLDLVWSYRVEERRWMVAEFPDEWALFLCGPLDRLSEEDRAWWRGWVYPEFAGRVGTEVEALDAIERLRRLARAYEVEMANRDRNVAEFANRAQRVLLSEGPVIALSKGLFYQQIEQVRGSATSILHDGDFMELEL